MRTKSIAAALLMAAGIASSAHADVVFDGGLPNGQDGLFANAGYVYPSSATRFTLDAPLAFNGISWWGGYAGFDTENAPDANDRFRLRIFSAADDMPGSLVTSMQLGSGNRAATGNLVAGTYDEYNYNASFADMILGPGTYFLALSNRYLGSNNWFWETTSGGQQFHGAVSFNTDSHDWELADFDDVFFDLAFQLMGTRPVSEPSVTLLLMLGLAALAARRRAG